MNSLPKITSVNKSQAKSAKNTKSSRSSQTGWIGAVNVTAVVGIVFALSFYVYTINGSVSKGYDLKKQQAAMEELVETEKRLMVQQASLGAIVKVNEVASISGMVPVTNEEFLIAGQLSSR